MNRTWITAPLMLLVLVWLTSCAATLNSHIEQCLAFGGSPAYKSAGNAVNFECR